MSAILQLFEDESGFLTDFTYARTAAYLFIMYHLPNRAYYEQIAKMDQAHLRNTLSNVLLYSGLQLVSLVILNYVLWRKMQFSVFRQLSFVLEKQWIQVQHKLVFWVFYNVQTSLQHFGRCFHVVLILVKLLNREFS